MAIIDDRTEGRNYALPNAANKLKDDVVRVKAALTGIDADVVAILLALAQKAGLDHEHSIAEITGLVEALNGKIAVGYHDALDDLSDVSVTGAANGQVLIKQGSTWIPIALQVGNITNLETLLNAKASLADVTAAVNGIIGAAPGALDTLIELATALGNDPNFATTLTNALALKAPLASPILTGTPTAPTATAGTNTTQLANTAFVANSAAIARMNTRPNLMVNCSLIDSQENGNTLGTTNGYFAADQFALYYSAATAAMSIQRVQSSKSLAGSANKLEFKTTTAKASLAATDFVLISQPIEGSRPDFVAAGWGAAGAKQFMFRVDQQLTAGLYHVHVQNSAGNRHIAVPFTATGAEAVTEVAIPGDTSGTWLTAEGTIGAVFDIVLAAGSSRTGGTASVWGATTYYAASTQKNILDSTANVARLGDFGLRLDSDATGVYGAYRDGEVDSVYRSERYLQTVGSATGIAANSTAGVFSLRIFQMAKNPIMALNIGGNIYVNGTVVVPSSISAGFGPTGGQFNLNLSAPGFAAGQALAWFDGKAFIGARLS